MALKWTEIKTARLTEGIDTLRDAMRDPAQGSRIPEHLEFLIELVEIRARNEGEEAIHILEVIARKLDCVIIEQNGDLEAVEAAVEAFRKAEAEYDEFRKDLDKTIHEASEAQAIKELGSDENQAALDYQI